jgi:hypothetical protein
MNQINPEADQADDVLRLSLDAKATVKIGCFSRGGKNWVQRKAADHDFKPDATLTWNGKHPGGGTDYPVLYEGTGGNKLQVTNVTINGNAGVGGTGKARFNGPGTISGRFDFSAANTGQFRSNNGSNVGPAHHPE